MRESPPYVVVLEVRVSRVARLVSSTTRLDGRCLNDISYDTSMSSATAIFYDCAIVVLLKHHNMQKI